MKTQHTLEVSSKRPRTNDDGFKETVGLVEKLVNSYSRRAFDLFLKIIPEDVPLRTVFFVKPNPLRGKIHSLNSLFVVAIPLI